MNIQTPLSRDLQLDELEMRGHANDQRARVDCWLLILVLASTVMMGLTIVGGVDVFNRVASWVQQW